MPGDLCRTELPDLLEGNRRGHLKRCHLANPDDIYAAEVLPEIAPDLAEALRPDVVDDDSSFAPEDR